MELNPLAHFYFGIISDIAPKLHFVRTKSERESGAHPA